MERELIRREQRKFLIVTISSIVFLTIWVFGITRGFFKSHLSDVSVVVYSLIVVDIFQAQLMFLPLKRAIKELKTKGYQVSEDSVSISQTRKIEMGMSFETAFDLCLSYLKSLSNCEIVEEDHQSGYILAKHRISEKRLTRDRIEFDFLEHSGDKNIVEVRRYPNLNSGAVVYGSRNYIFMEEMLGFMKYKAGLDSLTILEP